MSFKRERRSNTLSESVHAWEVYQYVKAFHSNGMSQKLAKAAMLCYKARRTNRKNILSKTKQRAFVQEPSNDRKNIVPDWMNDGKDSKYFNDMVTAGEVSTFGIRGTLQEIRLVCKDGGKAMPTTYVDVSGIVWECFEMIH